MVEFVEKNHTSFLELSGTGRMGLKQPFEETLGADCMVTEDRECRWQTLRLSHII